MGEGDTIHGLSDYLFFFLLFWQTVGRIADFFCQVSLATPKYLIIDKKQNIKNRF
jgi:hypothetical protein